MVEVVSLGRLTTCFLTLTYTSLLAHAYVLLSFYLYLVPVAFGPQQLEHGPLSSSVIPRPVFPVRQQAFTFFL